MTGSTCRGSGTWPRCAPPGRCARFFGTRACGSSWRSPSAPLEPGCRRASRSARAVWLSAWVTSVAVLPGSRHDVDPAIDVRRRAGHAACEGRGAVGSGGAPAPYGDEITEGRALDGFVEQQIEVAKPGGGPRLHGTGRDRVHADVLWPQLVRQVAARGLERRLHGTHHVVIRDDLLGAVIAHREHRSA